MSANPTPAPVHLRLLGPASWQQGDGAPTPLSAKDAALLAKLALDGPQARTLLCALLWPDAAPHEASANLRQRSSRLFRATGGVVVVQTGDPLSLGPQVSVDVQQLDNLDDAALAGVGGLLAGIDLGHLSELDDWLTRARAQVTERCAQRLTDRAQALEDAGRLRDALPLVQRVVALLPLAEHGWRRLMRLHYLRNDRAAAQEAFWRLNTLLRDELGIRPSAETLQLMQTIEAADAAPVLAMQPVPVSVLRPPVLVGRSQPWQAMATAWQQRQPFLLLGEAGLGKTRLLEDFLLGQPNAVAERAQPGDDAAPYAVLGRVLLAIAHRFAPALAAADRAELARLHPGFGQPPEAPAHERVLWQAIERLLAEALRTGLGALVLDDLHCADRATLDALRWLSASPALGELRLGLASRPMAAAQAPWTAWLQDSHRPVQIALQPLTPAELSALLASLALPTMLDATLSAQLYRHAGGHPLFTLATLQDAMARGADLHGALLPRPSTVQSLLDARLASLGDAARDLLRVAAVAGPDLRADRLARLLGCSVLALAEPWAQLEAANVLRGEAFSHDLVHDSALRAVPQGVRQALHRQLAALLAGEDSANPARLAWHWQHGGCWPEAGRSWQAAALAAQRAGRLAEAGALFERAADCQQRAGDDVARFEALHARLGGLQLRLGGLAVLAALPDVEALASTALMRLRCQLSRATALGDAGRWAEATRVAQAAAQAAPLHPALLADALALQAELLGQCGQTADARASAQAALDAAQAVADPLQQLRALEALAFVSYSGGQLAEALRWQQRAVVQAEAIGARTEAVTNDSHVAALLAATGDVPGSHAQALRVQQAQRALGLGDNSTIGVVNQIILGSAAAALGRFDQAWDALHAAVALAGAQAAPAAQAKARLALAHLWLLLGRPDPARALLAELPAELGTGMRLRAALLWVRAGALDGRPADQHLATLGAWQPAQSQAALVESPDWEWSFQGAPQAVVARLQKVRAQCEATGAHGAARALQWRELARWLEIDGDAATTTALMHARALAPHAATGLSAKCHPPQTWQTLWQAFGRAGDGEAQAACAVAARRWLDEALPSVPAAHREAFASGHPLHRWWRQGGQP